MSNDFNIDDLTPQQIEALELHALQLRQKYLDAGKQDITSCARCGRSISVEHGADGWSWHAKCKCGWSIAGGSPRA